MNSQFVRTIKDAIKISNFLFFPTQYTANNRDLDECTRVLKSHRSSADFTFI